jgi:AcrR family transcriptional regulator
LKDKVRFSAQEIIMNKDDRRVVRTRRLLKQALVDLMDDAAYEAITIRDITDRADIGYATFFRHYDGKDDLMLELMTEIIVELESLPHEHAGVYFEQEGNLLFQHVKENQAMYRSILDSRPFARKLREHIKGIVQMHLYSHAGQLTDSAIPLEIAANHMVASLLGLIDWWLFNAMPYPIEQMAMIYRRLIVEATWHALGPENEMRLPWEEEGD